MSASDASVAVFGSFCVLALLTMVATFWSKSRPEAEDQESQAKVGADRLRATLSQFRMSDFQKSKKWLSLLYEFIQVRMHRPAATDRHLALSSPASLLPPSPPPAPALCLLATALI
jgi:hypothetical protein